MFEDGKEHIDGNAIESFLSEPDYFIELMYNTRLVLLSQFSLHPFPLGIF